EPDAALAPPSGTSSPLAVIAIASAWRVRYETVTRSPGAASSALAVNERMTGLAAGFSGSFPPQAMRDISPTHSATTRRHSIDPSLEPRRNVERNRYRVSACHHRRGTAKSLGAALGWGRAGPSPSCYNPR